MAATPPRPASPAACAAVVVPKAGHTLQISPNLEALLEHDELTRRNSGSPTSAYRNASSPEFSISLPPPPPRKAHGGRRHGREQEATIRSKEGQRRNALGSDLWPDALPATFSPDATGPSGSRPVTPNPFINPTPVLMTQPLSPSDTCLADAAQSEPNSDLPPPGRPSPSDPSHRLNKVEKILWLGRDSLSLFSGSASKSDRRGDLDAVPYPAKPSTTPLDRQIRQEPRPPSSCDTATLSSRGISYPHTLLQRSNVELFETASTRSCSIYSDTSSSPHLLPRLSLPSPSMSYEASRPKSLNGHEYLSFIDFFSPSTTNDSNMHHTHDKPCSSRRQPQSISIPHSPSHHSHSSTSLASMRFAPPSPSSLAVQQLSPVYSPADSSSSVALSTMRFAPPSPSTGRVSPSWLQPLSDPPSPYSPLEFAPPPCSPREAIDKPSLPTASELAPARGRKFKPGKRSVSLSPLPARHLPSPLPPTTNQLDANVRADRVRRNRKLARVFGRTPGTDGSVSEANEHRVSKKSHSPSLTALLTKQKHHRHAVSVSVALKSPGMKTEPCTPWQTEGLWSHDSRRHSIPLTPGSFTLYVDDEQDARAVEVPRREHKVTDSPETASTRSFIDLSDEDTHDDDDDDDDDDTSGLGFLAPAHLRHRRLHQSSSTPSLVESFDSEAQAEADRRQKRERLARLHRFLGSRVPPEAINGNVFGPPLPPAAPIPEEPDHQHWLRSHKNARSDDFDRGREELDEREKALNVRRAQKMERVFGTPPPQTLFHTRPGRPIPASQPTSPTSPNPYVLTIDIPSVSRNPNQSAYVGKTIRRRGPSESSRCLLPRRDDTPQPSPSGSFAQSFAESFEESLSGYQQVLAQSSVYLNYQHSLNSLVDIIDRDDRQSLVELHRFLHSDADKLPLDEETDSHHLSVATFRSERRHSLPSKASLSSLSSEYHAPSEASWFQIRRRKAAKLTNFFGVDYRELIRDILESIEKGVEEERSQGTLQPQEVEVLMHRVRSLRAVKDPFS